jgi:hypothetical protein
MYSGHLNALVLKVIKMNLLEIHTSLGADVKLAVQIIVTTEVLAATQMDYQSVSK